jgi:hypothetical protein
MGKRKNKKRRWVKWLLALGVLLFLWSMIFGFSSRQPGYTFNKNHNAVWIGHEWVGEEKTEAEIKNLVDTLSDNAIDLVFVHTGPFESDGSVDRNLYLYAVDFLEKAQKYNSEIKYQAWLGQIRGKIDLSDVSVRENVAQEAVLMTQVIGFDGVHFDIEPVWDEDLDFIETLKLSREAMPKEKNISVALAEFIPKSLVWLTEELELFENFNSEVNYENVAQYADQLVVMTYDTGINKDWLYRWLVKEQTIWLTRLLEGKEVFVGIPAYEEVKEGFDPEIENVSNGMKGIVSGLNNSRSKLENFAGAAIYSYWEIEEDEWEDYNNIWIK